MSETNRKLAEATGLCVGEYFTDVKGAPSICTTCHQTAYKHKRPQYDTDISAAFDLVAWMRKEHGVCFKITCDAFIWDVELMDAKAGHSIKFLRNPVDKSLPRAISIACLRALGLEEK